MAEIPDNPKLTRPSSSIFRDVSDENVISAIDHKKNFYGILRHIPLILGTTLLMSLAFIYLAYKLLHTYTADAVLIYQERLLDNAQGKDFDSLHLTLNSAVETVTLPVNLKAVKSILGLDYSIEQLKKMITVDVTGKQSNLIDITVKGDNPSLVIDIANTLAKVAVNNSQQLSQKQRQDAYKYYDAHLNDLRQQLQKQLIAISDFRKQNHLTGVDFTNSDSMTSMAQSESKLSEVSLEYTSLLVQYENLKREYEGIPDFIPQAPLEAEGGALKTRLSQIQIALLDARSHLAPDNPKIKALEQQLDALMKSTQEDSKNPVTTLMKTNPIKEKLNLDLMSMNARLRATQKLKEDLSDQVNKLHTELSSNTQLQLNYNQLILAKTQLEDQIKITEQNLQNVNVQQNLGKSDIELYHDADRAFSPDNFFLYLFLPVLGFLLGLGLGLGSAFILEVMDNKLRTPRQVEIAYEVPNIATIPEFPNFTKANAQQLLLGYIRTITERLHLINENIKSLTVLSSRQHEGKSTIAYQLAQYSNHTGKKTVLVEFDYRENPFYDTHQIAEKGLESYLQGQATFNEILYRADKQPDRIKTHYDPGMKELIKNQYMKKLWQELNQNYELIIIDSPGILEDEYSINLGRISNETLFIIGSSRTGKKVIDSCLKHLEQYSIIPTCFVMNRVLPIYLDDHTGNKHVEEHNGWIQKLIAWIKK
jgi:capsular polysaccharide biosynthesis protein/cellulose biosynthesis protein BcsQ